MAVRQVKDKVRRMQVRKLIADDLKGMAKRLPQLPILYPGYFKADECCKLYQVVKDLQAIEKQMREEG